jgi:hypothetical protein
MTQRVVTVVATSNRGRSRIGKDPTTAVVEQSVGDKLFVVWPDLNQCRWIHATADPDFTIIPQP